MTFKDTTHNLYFKYLPHTILASDAVFYTDIFSIELWKQQRPGTQFIDVLWTKSTESNIGQDISLLLEFCGRLMDGIEEELRSNSKSRSQVGLSSFKVHTSLPKGNPTNWLFLMLLTDRILWAHSQPSSELSIPSIFKLHQHPHSEKYDHQCLGEMPMSELYLTYNNAAAKTLLSSFFSSVCQLDSLHPNWDLGPSKALTSTEDISNAPGSPLSEQAIYESHANLIKHSIQLGAHAHLTRSLANVFWLASSAKFLLMSFDSKYMQNLNQSWSEINDATAINDLFKALLESDSLFKDQPALSVTLGFAHEIQDSTSANDFPIHFTHQPWPYAEELRGKVQHKSHHLATTSEPPVTPPLSTLPVPSPPQGLPLPLNASPHQAVPLFQHSSPVLAPPQGLPLPLNASPHQAVPLFQHASLPSPPSTHPHTFSISSPLSRLSEEPESYHPVALSTANFGEEGGNNIGESDNDDSEGENDLSNVALSTANFGEEGGNNIGESDNDDSEGENDLSNVTPSTAQEDQDPYLIEGAGVLSPMSDVTFEDTQDEQLQPEQFPGPHDDPQLPESHLGKRKRDEKDSDAESEISEVQMKSGQKPAIQSYIFKTFVDDGNGLYQAVDAKYQLEWFKGLDRVHKSFDIQQLAFHEGVDIHMQHEVHGIIALHRHNKNDWQTHIYQSSLLKAFQEKRKAVNFLEIPTTVSTHRPNILPLISYDTLAGNHTMNGGIRFPQYGSRWRLCATEGAFSRAHIDAGKYGTWIRIVHGTKLWVVMLGDIPETPLTMLDYKKHKWTYYLLEPGDQLFMPAGTIHAVMTLNDTGLREHRQGLADCNTEHPDSEYILHALLKAYYGIFLSYFPHQKPEDECGHKWHNSVLIHT
ncbi:hypothetical protein BU17DRAFT_83392 [Hysterangium stoloniferum]|nr:hypothetical protein BU17DRAFT_83392 [Hysterangium stoloniferum]